MAEKTKSDKGPPKRFENSKVKFLPSEEVISMSSGTIKRCIKTTTTTVVSSRQTAPPTGDPTPTQTSMAKSDSERLLPAKKMLFGEPASASSSGSKDMGYKLSSLKGQLPYRLAPIAWKGSLQVHDLVGNTIVELVAYLPLQVSAKLYSATVMLPEKLQMKLVPHFTAWPKQFETECPNLEDIGVYLIPSERSSRLKCTHLLRQLDFRKHALKMNVNACLELVVHSSQLLVENSQRIGEDLFFWGFFWKRKTRSGSQKKKFTSSNVTPGKTSSELGASSEFRTPIGQDKRADILKHNQVGNEVIIDISDVCENNSLEEEVVADTFYVPPGFTKPSIGQEISPMDRQSETNMQGKDTQPANQEVVPDCSSISYIANKGSGHRRFFSSIGVGILEATLEGCENQEEFPEAPYLIDMTSEKIAEEAESKRMSEQPDASPGIAPNLSGSEIASQILIKHEKEPLVPLPVDLEIPPGFSREVGAKKGKSISNQQLETPPGFGTLGRVSIKHEREPSVPLPVGLEIPPGFSRRVEARKEKNIPNEYKGSPLSVNQVLNVPRSVPDNFMDKPLLENQGIIHHQTPVGEHTVVFSYPVIQRTTSQSCSAQPTSPGGIRGDSSMLLFQGTSQQRAIPEVSLNHLLTIQGTGLTELYPEMGPKEASKNSKNNQDAFFSQMVAQSQNENHCLSAALYNANAPAMTYAPPHFCDLNPSFLASSSSDGYHPSVNKKMADITPMTRGEGSQRENVRRSPMWSRERSRSRSPGPRWHKSRCNSPVPRRYKSRSRSPVPRGHRSRSRSPVPRRHRSRSRSSVSRRHRSQSRSNLRWYGNPVYRRNATRVRSPVHPGNSRNYGQYSSRYKSRHRSRSRGDSGSCDSSPLSRRGRNRSRSLSPPPPVELFRY